MSMAVTSSLVKRFAGTAVLLVDLLVLASPAYPQQPTTSGEASPASSSDDKKFDYMNEDYSNGSAIQAITRKRPVFRILFEITVFHTDRRKVNRAIKNAFKEVKRIEKLLSAERRENEISAINFNAGKKAIRVSSEMMEIIRRALAISKRIKGAFDITFAPLKRLWKFDEEFDPRPPRVSEVAKMLPLIDYCNVVVNKRCCSIMLKKKDMEIDVSGLAKGYAIDRVVVVLRREGLRDFRIKIGHSFLVSSRMFDGRRLKPWEVSLPDPRNVLRRKSSLLWLRLPHVVALFTSWDRERYFIYKRKRYHHIMDPKTGFPAELCSSVSVVTGEVIEADMWVIVIFVMGRDKGLKIFNVQKGIKNIIVDRDGTVHFSKNIDKFIATTTADEGVK